MLIICAYNDVDVLPDRAEVYYASMTYDRMTIYVSYYLFVLIGSQFNSYPFFGLAYITLIISNNSVFLLPYPKHDTHVNGT